MVEVPGPSVDKREIWIGADESRVIRESIQALGQDLGVFRRGEMLARIIREDHPDDGLRRPRGAPVIQALPVPNLRERLTVYANFCKRNAKGETVPAHPPAWLAPMIDCRGEWPGIRPLYGVSDAPVLRDDGTVHQEPGYDERSGVLFDPLGATFPPVHPEVTIDDADAAVRRLMEVVCDFPFEGSEHRSAWLAGLLTPLARFAFTGPAPIFFFDANIRAAGKGLLAQTIARIVLGCDMPVSGYTRDDAEMEKRITAVALAGDRMVLLDNVDGLFGSGVFDRMLTATRWKERLLGENKRPELPLLATWYATGNNVQVAADTCRRMMHVRLEAMEENPEERADFRHPDLLRWISDHRGQFIADALTILSGYCNAGRPSQHLTPFGSFEGWSGLVREAIVWAGQPDPCITRVKLAESADANKDHLRQLLSAWGRSIGTVSSAIPDILARLYPAEREYMPRDEASNDLRAAFEVITGCPPGKIPDSRKLGNQLRALRKRVVDDQYLDRDEARSKAGVKWSLRAKAA